MGFKCPICHKDFGTDRKEMESHLESHSDKTIVDDLERLNRNEILISAIGLSSIIKAEDIIKKEDI